MKSEGSRCNEYGILTRQRKNDLLKELFRKSIHICSAAVPFLLHVFGQRILIALACVVVCYTVAEIFRLKGRNIPVISQITAVAARKRDENRFVLGPVTLSCGIILCSLAWKPLPASIGIYALAFGDGLASLSGKLFGKVQIPFTQGKTATGSLTCFTAIFISTYASCGRTHVSLIVASVGMFIELLPLKDFDNIFIPLVLGGLAQYLLFP